MCAASSFLTRTADHDRDPILDWRRLEPKVVEPISPAGLRGDLLAVQERTQGGDRFVEPVEPLADRSELDAVRGVLS